MLRYALTNFAALFKPESAVEVLRHTPRTPLISFYYINLAFFLLFYFRVVLEIKDAKLLPSGCYVWDLGFLSNAQKYRSRSYNSQSTIRSYQEEGNLGVSGWREEAGETGTGDGWFFGESSWENKEITTVDILCEMWRDFTCLLHSTRLCLLRFHPIHHHSDFPPFAQLNSHISPYCELCCCCMFAIFQPSL